MKFPLFLFGYCKIETDQRHVADLLDQCLRFNLTLTDFQTLDDGGVRFYLGSFSAIRLNRACRKKRIPVRAEYGGMPQKLFGLRRRVGLIFGVAVGIFLLAFSSRFVWSVRVSGNENVTAGEIRQALATQGLEVGSYLPDVDLSAVETQTLLSKPNLAWMAIHMEGTVAYVQVTERVEAPEKKDRPANLVASCDGQIEELELYRGKAVVKVGQPVRAGDLLVSGVYDSQTVGYRYTRAAGRVLARTRRTICIEVPFSYTEKVYEEPIHAQTILQFFKFSFNFFKNSRNQPVLCDIIETTTGNDWIGMHDLPVSVRQISYLPYTERTATRTTEQALEQAYSELDDALAALSDEIVLIEKRIQTHITDDRLILECTLNCVENIAIQSEFDAVDE